VLDESQRRGAHGCERDERRAPPGSNAMRVRMRPPGTQQLVRLPHALQRDAHRLVRVEPARDVVRDRVLQMIAKLGVQPPRARPLDPSGDVSEIPLGLAHWLSTAWMLAANCSQSFRRPSSAFRPCAVRS
jgi:hypothetical protein